MPELSFLSQPLSPDAVASIPSSSSSSSPRTDREDDEEHCNSIPPRRRQRRRTLLRVPFLTLSMILLLCIHYLHPNSCYTAFAEDEAVNDDQAAAAANDSSSSSNNNDAAVSESYDSSSSSSSSSINSGTTDDAGYGYGDDTYRIAKVDAAQWNWANGQGFGGISVMPISCINFNNGHMIKFELFESDSSYQCHFAKIGTWVVSIAHFMRAYFNHQALVHGRDFTLPGDAGYLNCIMLQETAYSATPLYAKIGCVERETLTSTRLQLHVYQDSQCSKAYDDGRSNKYHALRGYDFNGYTFSTHVSFRPPFYSCEACTAEQISSTFNKKYGTWYDDDYISQNGKSSSSSSSSSSNNNNNDQSNNNNDQNNNANNNANSAQATDDNYRNENYLAANDDVNKSGNSNSNNNKNDDGGKNNNNNNNNKKNGYSFNDDYFNDDARRHLKVAAKESRQVSAQPGLLEAYHQRFWQEYDRLHRKLYDNQYDAGNWNFCQRLYKYAVWCDHECRSLDLFRNDKWSKPDVLLLVIMCTFFTAMLLLIVAKRLKAAEKARVYGHEHPLPGLPPLAMGVIFLVATAVISALAVFKFVNETLVFAVVICILVFIYMLRLTLFEPRRPVLLATPQHEMFDNPLDDKLFD